MDTDSSEKGPYTAHRDAVDSHGLDKVMECRDRPHCHSRKYGPYCKVASEGTSCGGSTAHNRVVKNLDKAVRTHVDVLATDTISRLTGKGILEGLVEDMCWTTEAHGPGSE